MVFLGIILMIASIYCFYLFFSLRKKVKYADSEIPYDPTDKNCVRSFWINGVGTDLIGKYQKQTIDDKLYYTTYKVFVFIYLSLYYIKGYRMVSENGGDAEMLGCCEVDRDHIKYYYSIVGAILFLLFAVAIFADAYGE